MNVRMLKAKMVNEGVSTKQLGKFLDLSKSSIYLRMSGMTEFRLPEVAKIRLLLELSDEETIQIFFS